MRRVGLILCLFLSLGARRATNQTYFRATPLVDFQPGQTYQGFSGLLYDGSNQPPADYVAYGQAIAQGVTPLDANGNPDPSGTILFLGAGMSNASDVFCGTAIGCTSTGINGAFMAQAAASPVVNHTTLRIFNGAKGGQSASFWTCAYGPSCGDPRQTENEYDRIAIRLSASGLTEAQVQIVWYQNLWIPNGSFLPSSNAMAYVYEQGLGDTLRAMHTRWPNLRVVILSVGNYLGFAGWDKVQDTTGGAIEPYMYESGFSVKWLVAAKIAQWRTGMIDPRAGDLSTVPVVTTNVGSYLWGNGTTNPPSSLALLWSPTLLESDGVHPNAAGIAQAGPRILAGLLTDPATASWMTGN